MMVRPRRVAWRDVQHEDPVRAVLHERRCFLAHMRSVAVRVVCVLYRTHRSTEVRTPLAMGPANLLVIAGQQGRASLRLGAHIWPPQKARLLLASATRGQRRRTTPSALEWTSCKMLGHNGWAQPQRIAVKVGRSIVYALKCCYRFRNAVSHLRSDNFSRGGVAKASIETNFV